MVVAEKVNLPFAVFPVVGEKVGIKAFIKQRFATDRGIAGLVVPLEYLPIDFQLPVDAEVKLLIVKTSFVLLHCTALN